MVVSNDSDCPAISTRCAQQVRGQGFVHKVSNQFIYIDKLFELLDFLDATPDSVVAVNALGGNDLFPGTHSVAQTCYLQALVRMRALTGGWKYLGMASQLESEQNFADTEAVVLTVLAFIEVQRYASQLSNIQKAPAFISSMRHSSRHEFSARLED